MDTNGARHLRARLAIGVPVGSRFEVVAVGDSGVPLSLGDTGTLLSVADGSARVRVDWHGEIEIDPNAVTLRRLLQQTA
jgi:hypothetical protein